MEYIFIFVLVVILANNYKYLSYKDQYIFILFIAVYIILLMGLRYRVGMDTLNYMSNYNFAPTLKEFNNLDFSETRFEPGYLLLCSLCKSITPDFWLLQLLHSLILCICVFKFIKKNVINPFIGIAVYMYLAWLYFNTEIIRESLAIGVFLLNYSNLKENKLIKYYIISFVSIGFHFSAIITLFFPLVKYLRFNVLYIIACILIVMIIPFAEQLTSYINIISITNRIDEHISSADTLNFNWRIANLIKNVSVSIISVIIYRKLKIKSDLTPFILFHTLMGIGAFSIPIIFSRLSNYTLPFVIIYVANLISLLSEYKCKFIKFTLIVFLFMSQLFYYKDMFYAWFPYVSIFDKNIVYEREKLFNSYFN